MDEFELRSVSEEARGWESRSKSRGGMVICRAVWGGDGDEVAVELESQSGKLEPRKDILPRPPASLSLVPFGYPFWGALPSDIPYSAGISKRSTKSPPLHTAGPPACVENQHLR